MSQQIERFLTPPQVAKVLGVSSEHVTKFIASGELRAMNTSLKDRPRWKISREDFDAFVNRRSNQTSASDSSRRSRRKVDSRPVKQFV
jgi:excisionase family DNA binding protein